MTADLDPTFRGVFVIRSSIKAAGDGNPFNDEASDQVAVDRPPDDGTHTANLTPYVSAPREKEYTVGVNDLFRPTVFNIGPSSTEGTVTITVELGPGFTFLQDRPDDWDCSRSCTR